MEGLTAIGSACARAGCAGVSGSFDGFGGELHANLSGSNPRYCQSGSSSSVLHWIWHLRASRLNVGRSGIRGA